MGNGSPEVQIQADVQAVAQVLASFLADLNKITAETVINFARIIVAHEAQQKDLGVAGGMMNKTGLVRRSAATEEGMGRVVNLQSEGQNLSEQNGPLLERQPPAMTVR